MKEQTQQAKKPGAKKQLSTAQGGSKKPSAKSLKAREISAEERQGLIAEAAYYIAEQRGFQGDLSMDDWLQAEAEVDAQFAAMH